MSSANFQPWMEEKWLSGVLNHDQMKSLETNKILIVDGTGIDIGLSSIDLHLSAEGYFLKNGTIKPNKKDFLQITKDPYYAVPLEPVDGIFELKAGCSYLFKVLERFHPASIKDSPIHGQATAKSSIGRLDVIVRLIVDGMEEYETMSPQEVKSGFMFLEISPITFNVRVKEGVKLSQLRFFNGHPTEAEIKGEFVRYVLNNAQSNGTLSVDITPDRGIKYAAFCAKPMEDLKDKFLDLWLKKAYKIADFWNPINASPEPQNGNSLKIQKDNFYILRSKERISLPGGVAVYCRAMDETLGELRIHYAGFVHPFFGYKREDGQIGTPLIFEVRGHNIDVNLSDNEKLARLVFYRMSKDENKIPPPDQGYNTQELKLSDYFEDWKG